ncbi:MAG: hypothetical protein JWQ40_880 [Segetibacter sp.]|nr:hypothetical protein [Segetibacter sp.]
MKRKAISKTITVSNNDFLTAIKESITESPVLHQSIVNDAKNAGIVEALISTKPGFVDAASVEINPQVSKRVKAQNVISKKVKS